MGSTCLCELYCIFSSSQVVKIWWLRVFITFRENDLILLVVQKPPSLKIVGSGGASLLLTDGWVFRTCCLKKSSRCCIMLFVCWTCRTPVYSMMDIFWKFNIRLWYYWRCFYPCVSDHHARSISKVLQIQDHHWINVCYQV